MRQFRTRLRRPSVLSECPVHERSTNVPSTPGSSRARNCHRRSVGRGSRRPACAALHRSRNLTAGLFCLLHVGPASPPPRLDLTSRKRPWLSNLSSRERDIQTGGTTPSRRQPPYEDSKTTRTPFAEPGGHAALTFSPGLTVRAHPGLSWIFQSYNQRTGPSLAPPLSTFSFDSHHHHARLHI